MTTNKEIYVLFSPLILSLPVLIYARYQLYKLRAENAARDKAPAGETR